MYGTVRRISTSLLRFKLQNIDESDKYEDRFGEWRGLERHGSLCYDEYSELK